MERLSSRLHRIGGIGRMIFIILLLIHLLLAWTASGQGKPESLSAKRAAVRQCYTSQIGVRETKPNSGPHVEKYLRYVGLPAGNPWCAAFVCWVLGQANVDNPRTGWSPGLFSGKRMIWVRRAESGFARRSFSEGGKTENGKLKTERGMGVGNGKWGMGLNAVGIGVDEPGTRSQEAGLRFAYPPSPTTSNQKLTTTNQKPTTKNYQPKPADIFGLYFPEKGRIAHVGFVDEWKDPWLITVEGNTNVLGSRDGDGVYRIRRLVRSVYQVARHVE